MMLEEVVVRRGWGLLYGIAPVVIGIVADAVLGLGRVAVKSVRLAVSSALVVVGYLLDVNVLVLLLGAGAIETPVRNAGRLRPDGTATVDPLTASVTAAVGTFAVMTRWPNDAWLIAAGAIVGVLHAVV